MQEVVQYRHREDTEQLRAGVVARELQRIVVGGHTGDESQHADDEKGAGDEDRRALHGHQLGESSSPLPCLPSTSLLTGR